MPDTRWSAAVDQAVGRGVLLGRMSYYGGWYDRRDTYRYRDHPREVIAANHPVGTATSATRREMILCDGSRTRSKGTESMTNTSPQQIVNRHRLEAHVHPSRSRRASTGTG